MSVIILHSPGLRSGAGTQWPAFSDIFRCIFFEEIIVILTVSSQRFA